MSTVTKVTLIDDTDGTDAAETLRFALDGSQYEIDLNTVNADGLRTALSRFITHARKLSRTAPARKHSAKQETPEYTTTEIRAWAVREGFTINNRGRIPADIVAKHRAAMLAASGAQEPATEPGSQPAPDGPESPAAGSVAAVTFNDGSKTPPVPKPRTRARA